MTDVADKAVDKIAAALQKAAPQGWDALVAAQRIEGIASVVAWLVAAAVAVVALRVFMREVNKSDNNEGILVGSGAVSLITITACLIAICAGGPDVAVQVFSPEAGAVREILCALN